MKTFVLGDIHGALNALKQCFERCSFDLTNDTLIQLGDITDGYPDVAECVELLLKVQNLVSIKGNHDDWFDEFINTDFHPQFWNYGGLGTLTSYLRGSGKPGMFRRSGSGYKTALISSDIPVLHRHFFRKQQIHYIDEKKRCFLHGGFLLGIPFDQQPPQEFYWNRTLWENVYQQKLLTIHDGKQDLDFPVKHNLGTPVADFSEVYLGHTPTTNWGSDQPLNAFNIWNLDTGAGHSGRLTIMDVDTKEYWQSDPLPKLYSNNFR